MTTYTLIARKDYSESWRCGCLDERYDSDFQLSFHTDPEELAHAWANYERVNMMDLSRDETGYECEILINGQDRDTAWSERSSNEPEPVEFDHLQDLMKAKLEHVTAAWRALQEKQKAAAEIARAELERKAIERREAEERAEYERLSKKFGGA